MKVLISIYTIEELNSCIEGGADIIDLKNPIEGSLGAAAPWFIEEVKKQIEELKEQAETEICPTCLVQQH